MHCRCSSETPMRDNYARKNTF
uniref:Uncharacterized protein n=1 Tax=Heterorhabditis bacteriophora TaxID=37862 RepID=A0A1I7WKY8_HETBA